MRVFRVPPAFATMGGRLPSVARRPVDSAGMVTAFEWAVALMCETEPMSENVENLIFETLKKIQAEQAASRERDAEILSRLSRIELAVARVARDEGQNYAELIEDRHTMDKLKERIERIERRLELVP